LAKQSGRLLLNLILFLILIIVTRLQELFTFLIPFRIALVTSLLAAVVFVFSSNKSCPVNLTRISQVKFAVALYLLCLFSIPFSVYKSQSFYFVVMGMSITYLFLYLLIYSVNSYADLCKVIWVYILGVLLLALFTCIAGYAGGVVRPSASSTYDTNDIAAIVVVTLPLVYFFVKQVRGMQKLFLGSTFIILLLALYLTQSRGGFLGLITIMTLLLIKDHSYSWMLKFVVVGILLMLFVQFAPNSYLETMMSITSEQDYNRTLEGGRIALWKSGIQLMLQNPLTGIGAGAIITGLGQSSGTWKTTHNSFIQIGTELGVGGLILFVSIILSSIVGMRRFRLQYHNDNSQIGEFVWLATALEVSLCGFCVVGFFLSWAYSPVFFFLVTLCGILKKMEFVSCDKRCVL